MAGSLLGCLPLVAIWCVAVVQMAQAKLLVTVHPYLVNSHNCYEYCEKLQKIILQILQKNAKILQ